MQRRAFRHDLEHTFDEGRPKITVLALFCHKVFGDKIIGIIRKKPKRKKRNIWLLAEHRRKHLTSAATRKRPQFRVRKFSVLAVELAALAIVLVVDADAFQTGLANDTRKHTHVGSEIRPGRIIPPVKPVLLLVALKPRTRK